jgi:hypothetical protein
VLGPSRHRNNCSSRHVQISELKASPSIFPSCPRVLAEYTYLISSISRPPQSVLCEAGYPRVIQLPRLAVPRRAFRGSTRVTCISDLTTPVTTRDEHSVTPLYKNNTCRSIHPPQQVWSPPRLPGFPGTIIPIDLHYRPC